MAQAAGPLAIVTGASTGIGYELALQCAEHGYNLVVVADESSIGQAAQDFRRNGAQVEAMQLDLAAKEGVDRLVAAVRDRPVDVLMANAGRGLGHGFLDQDIEEAQRVVDTNIAGTIRLVHAIGRRMRERKMGRILITGSIAGFTPGTYQAVYNATKSFLNSFSFALRHEIQDSGVTVTCLMPGATETEFFETADMLDTKVGAGSKADPADVARTGFEAMMRGDGDVVPGWQNRLQTAIANVTPADILAEQHRRMAEPGSAKR